MFLKDCWPYSECNPTFYSPVNPSIIGQISSIRFFSLICNISRKPGAILDFFFSKDYQFNSKCNPIVYNPVNSSILNRISGIRFTIRQKIIRYYPVIRYPADCYPVHPYQNRTILFFHHFQPKRWKNGKNLEVLKK